MTTHKIQRDCNLGRSLTPNLSENSPIDLSLKASSNSEPFVTASQQLTIYDCTIIDTCQACNTVELNGNGCKWCPYDGGCIYQSYTCNKGHPVASPNVCPSLEYLTGNIQTFSWI